MAKQKETENVPAVETAEVEVVETTVDQNPAPREPEHKNGVYTEYDVELSNGVRIAVEVITDKDELPARFSEMLLSGNFEGAILAQLTPVTRRIIDVAGASRRDLREVLSPVVERANELAKD